MTNDQALNEIKRQVYRNTDNFEMTISKDCYHTIIEALEKQIKKKPIKSNQVSPIDNIECGIKMCPSCRTFLNIYKGDFEPFVDDYCPNCGQHIDWIEQYDE